MAGQARNIYHQIDRAHREFTDEQLEQIASIVWRYRGEAGADEYKDIKGLCKAATLDEVRAAGYSLNSGRYVGVAENGDKDDGDFGEKTKELHSEFKSLTEEAHLLEKEIFSNIKKIALK